MGGVTRVGYGTVLLVARPTRPTLIPDEVAGRLRRLYQPLFPTGRASARWDDSGTCVIAAFGPDGADLEPASLTCWGLPVGANGDATDDELGRAVTDTAAARSLLGTWVLLSQGAAGLRLVSSSDLVHTLVRAEGPDGLVLATKGLAALVVAGAPVVIAQERVPELVLLDYVLGDEELLEGTTVLDEASTVELDERGARVSSYWSVEERFAPGPPTTAARLREVLGEDLRRLGTTAGAHVALTAGRDSTLVASCLAEQGLALPAFTMGDERVPDAIGAAAVAAACGVPHRCMPPVTGPVDVVRARLRSTWTEGMDTAWNLVGAGLRWDGPRPIVWLGGSGGEIGRAFYWAGARGRPRVDALVDALLPGTPEMHPAARAALRRRAADAIVAAGETSGRTGWASLDVLYARGRMRKWLMRTMPRPEARGLLAAYTGPAVVRALLDIPEDARRSGAVFDEALALREPDLREVARRALPAPSPPPPRPAWRRVAARVVPQPVRERRHRQPPQAVTGVLAEVLEQLVGLPLAQQALGGSWYRSATCEVGDRGGIQHQLWNVIAVESLAARLTDLS